MKQSLRSAGIGVAVLGVLAAAFIGGRAWAGGIPAKGALTYSGVLLKADGSPLTTAGHNLELKLWSTGPTGGTALCDTAVPAPTFMLDAGGRFSVALDESCTGAIGANAGAFVEILLDGTSLGRSKLGAVPYAIEANHAVSADVASGALKTTVDGLVANKLTLSAWQSYTPTVTGAGTGTIAHVSAGHWRRVGDSVEISITTNFSACGATGQLRWSLPTGVILDTTKNDPYAAVGSGLSVDSTVHPLIVTVQNANGFVVPDRAGDPGGGITCAGVGSAVRLTMSFPVAGWTISN